MNLTLEKLNALPAAEAKATFQLCCTASRWGDLMVASRPFSDLAACERVALQHWEKMTETDLLEAFAGHPKIGDVESLREKYADAKALAAGEQQGAASADEQTLHRLAKANHQYERQNGFIFIVCATGKSAAEMLGILEARLASTRTQELRIAASEQAKITLLRLKKLFHSTPI